MDTSPIIISMKTAIVAIVFTFILGLFVADGSYIVNLKRQRSSGMEFLRCR